MTPFGVTGNERVELNPGLETRILGLETPYSMISNPLSGETRRLGLGYRSESWTADLAANVETNVVIKSGIIVKRDEPTDWENSLQIVYRNRDICIEAEVWPRGRLGRQKCCLSLKLTFWCLASAWPRSWIYWIWVSLETSESRSYNKLR